MQTEIMPEEESVLDETSEALKLETIMQERLERYFSNLDGKAPVALYDSVMKKVEMPLITIALKYTGGNQCKAARWLGISRGTLRARMKEYNLL